MRDATIAQINNFGQTPTKLFDKPHPKKTVKTNKFFHNQIFFEIIELFMIFVFTVYPISYHDK